MASYMAGSRAFRPHAGRGADGRGFSQLSFPHDDDGKVPVPFIADGFQRFNQEFVVFPLCGEGTYGDEHGFAVPGRRRISRKVRINHHAPGKGAQRQQPSLAVKFFFPEPGMSFNSCSTARRLATGQAPSCEGSLPNPECHKRRMLIPGWLRTG